MALRSVTVLIAAIAATLGAAPLGGQEPATYSASEAPARYDEDRPSVEFHRSRRAAVLAALPEDAVAIVFSAPHRNRSNDVDYQYRQSSALYYLTGTTEASSVLLLVPAGTDVDGNRVREVLVVPERDPATESWMGRRLGAERAAAELGIEAAVPMGSLQDMTGPLLETQRVYLAAWPEGVVNGSPLAEQIAWLRERVPVLELESGRAGYMQRAILRVSDDESYRRIRGGLERFGGAEALAETGVAEMARAFFDAGSAEAWLAWKDGHLSGLADVILLDSILQDLREVKTDEELRFLQKAIDLTAAAHREAFRSIEPGLREYEIEAVIEYVFQRGGAEYTGFPSIVGSGENSIILHYESNRRTMEAGDVVVMDIGAEYRGYSADITRTVPVSGRFSDEQRLIYEAVLEAQEAAIAAALPGAGFGDVGAAASAVLAERLQELGLISSPNGLRRFLPHGVSHYLGLDVHDAGTYGPLRPGNVITVEPGIYIAPSGDVEERWWNIGIRIEDDVLITEEGPRVLSGAAPKTIEEIEALMAEPGLAGIPVGR
jgi:Xaa-Pro aminopeptidase